MDAFQEDKELMYDNVIVVDGDVDSTVGYYVWDQFVKNNPYTYSYGIPMVYRKDMTIGIISGTYEWSEYPLSDIQDYLAE